ncbi:1575_t:CDS:2, partial [Dentiscutata erythropus]
HVISVLSLGYVTLDHDKLYRGYIVGLSWVKLCGRLLLPPLLLLIPPNRPPNHVPRLLRTEIT